MKELITNEGKLWMKIRFNNSKYICEFTFAPDFESFICKNPDGTEQKFRRNSFPVRKPFNHFLNQFPKQQQLGQPIDVTKMGNPGKMIPLEWVMKFLVNESEELYKKVVYQTDSLETNEQKNQLMRSVITHKALGENMTRTIAFYYVARLHLSSDFYSVLFRVKGHPHYEGAFDEIYLANFSSTGKMIGLETVSGAFFNYVYSDSKVTGIISENTLKTKTVTNYNERIVEIGSQDLKIIKTIQEANTKFNIGSLGKFRRKYRFFKDFPGKFFNYKQGYECWVKKEKGLFRIAVTEGYSSKSKTHRFDFMKFEPAINLLWMKNKKDGKVWKFQFNQAKTSVKITKSDGSSVTLTR